MQRNPFAQRLREVQISHGLNAAQWIKKAGVSQNRLYDLYKGRTNTLSHETLEKLAAAIGMTVSQLTGEAVTPAASRQDVQISDGGKLPADELAKAIFDLVQKHRARPAQTYDEITRLQALCSELAGL